MANIGIYLKEAMGNAVLRGIPYTPPEIIYLSMHTAAPGDTGANEISGNGYARTTIAFDAPIDGTFKNSANAESPVALGDWGVITHFALWDAQSSGNLLFSGEFSSSISVVTSVFIRIKAGELSVTLV